MEDHNIGRLLRELPRENARPGFTQRVLGRLDQSAEAVRPRAWHPRLAVATALAALVVSFGVVRYEQSREAASTAEARRLLQEIRAEHQQLERELQALSEPPVVYLGGDERMDLVVNLDRVPAEDGPAPATYRFDTF
jgi:hypothetical protein